MFGRNQLAWLAVLGLCGIVWHAGAANAQNAPAPPVYTSIDDNGVDLSTGRFSYSATQTSVGPLDAGGLSRAFVDIGKRDNLTGSIATEQVPNQTGQTRYTVSFGNSSARFLQTSAGGTLNPELGAEGQSLTFNAAANTYTYVGSDGTVATFSASLHNMDFESFQVSGALVTSISKPNGEVLTYSYVNAPSSPWSSIAAVTSNLGYMVKYEYSGGTQADPWTLSKVTAVNLAADYCAPMAVTCSFAQSWNRVTFGTNGAGATTATDSLSRTTTYTFGTTNSLQNPFLTSTVLTQVQDPSGGTITINYSFGRVSSVSNGVGTWTYSYGGNTGELQTTVTDPLGHTRVVVTALASGRVTSDTDSLGRTISFQIDPSSGRVSRMTLPEGNYVDYAYDARGNVLSATRVAKPGSDLPNYVTSASFDVVCANPKTCNQPNSITEGGATTDFTYDAGHGGVLTVTGPAGSNGVRPQTRYTYTALYAWYLNAPGSLAQAAGPVYRLTGVSSCATQASCAGTADEVKQTTAYGSAGTPNNLQVSSQTSSAGNGSLTATTAYTYSLAGDVLTTDGPLAGAVDVVRSRFDVARQLVGQVGIDPDGPGGRPSVAKRITYKPNGKVDWIDFGTVASQSDADWANFATAEQQVFGYDAAGRQVSEKLTDGANVKALTQFSYDNANRLECVAVRMNPAAFGSPPAACTLGPAGSEGADRITRNTYYDDNRLWKVTEGYGTAAARVTETNTFRPNGKLQTLTDAKGNLTAYDYDGFDRLTKTSFPSANPNDYVQLTYDPTTWNVTQERRRDGQTVSFGYDGRGRVTSKTLPAASYGYDNFDRLTSATEGGRTISASFDALGRLTSSAGPLGSVGYQYRADGARDRMTWPDGFYVTYDNDNSGTVMAIRENGAASGPGVLATFTYDNLGRRQTLTRGNGVTTTYAYDPISRLQTLTNDLAGAPNDQTLTLGYNPAGQVKTRTSTNTAYAWTGLYNVDRGYTVNSLNQVTSSGGQNLSHDDRGNTTSDGVTSYGYDVDNRLISTSSGAALAYDPGSRLYQTTSSAGVVTRFAYDGDDVIGEYSSAGALLRRYVHGPSVDEPLVWYEGVGTSDRRWLTADPQGSVVAVTDGTGATTAIDTYDEYGIPGGANLGRFQYTGQIWVPEVGLYHFKARAYSPTLGRFMQPDPIGYDGGMNLYAYVGDDPVNQTDPSGTCATPACTVEVGEVVVTAARKALQVIIALMQLPSYSNVQFTSVSMNNVQVSTGDGKAAGAQKCPPAPLSPGGLHPQVQPKADQLMAQLAAAKIDARMGMTTRTIAQQNQLYAQGRTAPGNIVTNARGGDSNHNYGLAFDIRLYRNGQYVTNGSDPIYARAGQMGKGVGLAWGGDWKKPFDPSHFEYTGGKTLSQIKALKKAGKDVLCP